jgi:hypothetical protein
MAEPVPTFSLANLAAVYADEPEAAAARYAVLASAFAEQFGEQPEFFVRAPGVVCRWSAAARALSVWRRTGELDRRAHRLRGLLGAADGDCTGARSLSCLDPVARLTRPRHRIRCWRCAAQAAALCA